MIGRGLTAAAALAGTAVMAAAPVWADPPAGSYTATTTVGDWDGEPAEAGDVVHLVVNPCAADCIHVTNPNWAADGHLQGENWTWNVPCDGHPADVWTFDKAFLTGKLAKSGCDDDTGHVDFTVVKDG